MCWRRWEWKPLTAVGTSQHAPGGGAILSCHPQSPQRLRKPTEVHVNPSQSFVPWHCLNFLKSSMLSALPTTMQMGNITRPIVQAGKQRLRETKVHSFQSAGPWAGSSSPGNFQSRVRPTATEAPEQHDTSLNKSCR